MVVKAVVSIELEKSKTEEKSRDFEAQLTRDGWGYLET